MSEFKFACPVCGQHITASATASGTQLECPTCFQKIIVPQAPAGGDSKLILSASQVTKPRPAMDTSSNLGPLRHSIARPSAVPVLLLLLVLLCATGAGYYFLVGRSTKPADPTGTNLVGVTHKPVPPSVTYPIPTNTSWTLSLSNAVVPDTTAVGSIHGSGFLCERASLQGGNLSLRQGRAWPPDLGVNIVFFATLGEELGSKTIEVAPDRTPPLPKVTLRWKDDQGKPVTHSVNNGYALRVVFGPVANGRIPGKLYLGLPDDAKSFVAGTFDAEVRKPPPPKQKQPKAQKPAG